MITKELKVMCNIVIGKSENGLEAFNLYKETHPDLVFMDITMPYVNGIEGVKMITSYDSQWKIIMCSSLGQKSLIFESINAGAKDFIIKPFSQDEIKNAVLSLNPSS